MDKISFKPLSKNTWKDFEYLFGERGACGGCWCMSWRLKKSEFDKNKGSGNKALMRKQVNSGKETGILTYVKNEPVAWCSVAPREDFLRLNNSRVLGKVDDNPVWSIVCLYIDKKYRREGLSSEILKGVITYYKKKRIKILEGYPTEPYSENMPAALAWTGFPSAFIKAGFQEVERRSKSRPIMRYYY